MNQEEKLLKEVCCLVEKPFLFLAKFKDDYLNLPEEILITTMKKTKNIFHFTIQSISYQMIFY